MQTLFLSEKLIRMDVCRKVNYEKILHHVDLQFMGVAKSVTNNFPNGIKVFTKFIQ